MADVARSTQFVVEALTRVPVVARSTQAGVEVLTQIPIVARTTQFLVEVLIAPSVVPIIVLLPGNTAWKIHRIDSKPRGEETA
jgi:hypothetical protein